MQYQRRNNSFGRNRSQGQSQRAGGFRPRNNFQSRGRRQVKTLDPRFFVQRAIEQVEEVYTPTHSFQDFEFEVQIQDEFKLFALGMNLYSVLCIGGVSMYPQVQGLSRRPQFVIGTPGR